MIGSKMPEQDTTGTQVTTLFVDRVVHLAEEGLAGFGLTQALSYQVAPQLRDGRLKILLSDHEPPSLPVHVIHREGNRSSARVRALVDHLVDRLRATPSINQTEEAVARK
ncbi:MAG: LysR substrate-binding domain-containing protein [Byssovorax sp.]